MPSTIISSLTIGNVNCFVCSVAVQVTRPGSSLWKASWLFTRFALALLQVRPTQVNYVTAKVCCVCCVVLANNCQMAILLFLGILAIRQEPTATKASSLLWRVDKRVRSILYQSVGGSVLLSLLDTFIEALLIFAFELPVCTCFLMHYVVVLCVLVFVFVCLCVCVCVCVCVG